MYDVLYLDRNHGKQLVARGLHRDAACETARAEARRRHVGRMFLAGSEPGTNVIVIVDSRQAAA